MWENTIEFTFMNDSSDLSSLSRVVLTILPLFFFIFIYLFIYSPSFMAVLNSPDT